jgi:shikimate dehydrogenase
MTDPIMIPSPTGTTRLFAHLGDPIAQVQAPMLLNQLFKQVGVDALMMAMHVRPHNLEALVDGLKRTENVDGILVTVPHKIAICELADKLSTQAALAGTANALRRDKDGAWFAENFDGLGFVAGLHAQGHAPAGRRVVLFGAGGAGAAIASALIEEGVDALTVVDTNRPKAEDLVAKLNQRKAASAIYSGAPNLGDADMVINATPIGLDPKDPTPFSVDDVPDHAVVCDIIMKPAETRLLRAAAKRGLSIHPGIHMLTPQIQLYAEFFGIC